MNTKITLIVHDDDKVLDRITFPASRLQDALDFSAACIYDCAITRKDGTEQYFFDHWEAVDNDEYDVFTLDQIRESLTDTLRMIEEQDKIDDADNGAIHSIKHTLKLMDAGYSPDEIIPIMDRREDSHMRFVAQRHNIDHHLGAIAMEKDIIYLMAHCSNSKQWYMMSGCNIDNPRYRMKMWTVSEEEKIDIECNGCALKSTRYSKDGNPVVYVNIKFRLW